MANLPTDSLYPAISTTSDPAVDGSGKTGLIRFTERVMTFLNGLTPPSATVYDTGWVTVGNAAVVTSGTIQYRRIGLDVEVRANGNIAATLPTGNTPISATNALPNEVRPPVNRFGAAYLGGSYTGTAYVDVGGTVNVAQQSGASRASVQFTIRYYLG